MTLQEYAQKLYTEGWRALDEYRMTRDGLNISVGRVLNGALAELHTPTPGEILYSEGWETVDHRMTYNSKKCLVRAINGVRILLDVPDKTYLQVAQCESRD